MYGILDHVFFLSVPECLSCTTCHDMDRGDGKINARGGNIVFIGGFLG